MKQRSMIDTSDVAPTLQRSMDMPSTTATEDLDRDQIHVATDMDPNDKYIRDLAFMEEKVTFIVAKTRDKNEPNPIIAGCNGQSVVVERGKPIKEARKFLNSLINTTMDIDTYEYTDNDGLKQTRIETLHSPALQIQLIADPSGERGMSWFTRSQHGEYA